MPAQPFSVHVDTATLDADDLARIEVPAAVPLPTATAGNRKPGAAEHHGARDSRQAARERSGRARSGRASGAASGRSYAFRRGWPAPPRRIRRAARRGRQAGIPTGVPAFGCEPADCCQPRRAYTSSSRPWYMSLRVWKLGPPTRSGRLFEIDSVAGMVTRPRAAPSM